MITDRPACSSSRIWQIVTAVSCRFLVVRCGTRRHTARPCFCFSLIALLNTRRLRQSNFMSAGPVRLGLLLAWLGKDGVVSITLVVFLNLGPRGPPQNHPPPLSVNSFLLVSLLSKSLLLLLLLLWLFVTHSSLPASWELHQFCSIVVEIVRGTDTRRICCVERLNL
jgi:hypothetical protein